MKADYILANPPFNVSDGGGQHLREDSRWIYGTPPVGNANYAWIQHIISHLAPNRIAGFVLANGSMSSNQSGGGKIRKALIEVDLVERLTKVLREQFAKSARLEAEIKPSLTYLGW